MPARVRWLRTVSMLAVGMFLLPLAASPSLAADGEPVVTSAVQVTDDPNPVRAHSSPQVMRNPTNGELVIVESDPRSENRTCNAYISTDEGQSWQPGGNLMAEPYTDCSIHAEYGPYATGAFGEDGTLYVAFVASNPAFANPGKNPGPATPAAFGPAGDCGEAGPMTAADPGADDGRAGSVRAASTGRIRPARPLGLRAGPCDGRTHLVSHPPRRTPRHVFVARSTDGGRSFETTAVFKGPEQPVRAPERLAQEGINKGPMLAVDPTDSSRVYVGWRQGDLREDQGKLRSLVAASTDGAESFADPVDVSGERGGDFPALAVDDRGTLHAVYWARTFGVPEGETPLSPIYYRRSTDQGQTFSERVEVDPGNQDTGRPPLITTDPTSARLYVTWSAHPEPENGGEDFEGDTDIFLLASPDGGETWGERVVVNDDDDIQADQHLPGIAVADTGRIDLAWYDDRSPTRTEPGYQDVYYAASFDGGATFTPNVRINDRVIDRNIGVWGNNILSHHNVGVASGTEDVFFAWQDTRNGDATTQAEDIYAAQLDWTGTATAQEPSSRLLWAAIGAGLALLLAGAVLFGLTRLRPARR